MGRNISQRARKVVPGPVECAIPFPGGSGIDRRFRWAAKAVWASKMIVYIQNDDVCSRRTTARLLRILPPTPFQMRAGCREDGYDPPVSPNQAQRPPCKMQRLPYEESAKKPADSRADWRTKIQFTPKYRCFTPIMLYLSRLSAYTARIPSIRTNSTYRIILRIFHASGRILITSN